MSKLIVKKEVATLIYVIRNTRVIMDVDLADLYGVETGQLNRAVKRNIERFPGDFMFQLSNQEFTDLKCQIGISRSWGGTRKRPYVFTEQGVAMLSSVLRSKQASLVNVHIMRVFVKMREVLAEHQELACKIEQLEYRIGNQDKDISALFEAIRQLMEPHPRKKKRPIGFGRDES